MHGSFRYYAVDAYASRFYKSKGTRTLYHLAAPDPDMVDATVFQSLYASERRIVAI